MCQEENLRYFAKALMVMEEKKPIVTQLLTDGGPMGKAKMQLFYCGSPMDKHMFFTPPIARSALFYCYAICSLLCMHK